MSSPGQYLGRHLGSRDPAHLRRWSEAQIEGWRNGPKCSAIARTTGRPCQKSPMRGQSHCAVHLKGSARDRVDAGRVAALQAVIDRPHVVGVVVANRARSALAAIQRRRLHRAWLLDPTIEGRTIALSPGDERKAIVELARHGVGIDLALCTPRCRDRLLWAATRFLRGTLAGGEDAFRKRIATALRDEQRWRDRRAPR